MLSAPELKSLGNKAFSSQKYSEAIDLYTKAIALDPQNAVLFSNRAMCHLKLADWHKALQDCDTGLNLLKEGKSSDVAAKTKLLFRKASCFKGMKSHKLAKQYFEQVIQADPQNPAAKEELASLNDEMERSEGTSGQRIHIPVTKVDQLPEEYDSMINKPQSKAQNIITEPENKITSLPNRENTGNNEELEREINELFGNKRKPTKPQTSSESDFVKRSTTASLLALKNIPGANKANAYNYVINMPSLELADDFSYGIEPEFLAFYLESAVYVSSNDSVENWGTKILNTLKAFANIKRFTIAKSFCDENQINSLLENVSKKHPRFLDDYRSILQ